MSILVPELAEEPVEMKDTHDLRRVLSFRETLYQDNLKLFREKTLGKELLNLRETATLLGFKDTRTVKKLFPFVNGYICVSTLARCVTPGFEAEVDHLMTVLKREKSE